MHHGTRKFWTIITSDQLHCSDFGREHIQVQECTLLNRTEQGTFVMKLLLEVKRSPTNVINELVRLRDAGRSAWIEGFRSLDECVQFTHTRMILGKKTTPRKKNYTPCAHNKNRTRCTECRPRLVCPCGKIRYKCTLCRPELVCPCGKSRYDCSTCRRCEHDRYRAICRTCSAHRFCAHGRLRCQCAECRGMFELLRCAKV